MGVIENKLTKGLVGSLTSPDLTFQGGNVDGAALPMEM
jgi:hypothetical protein